jgi:8-oxo-dGTP pyrophosphatase MutT (NUDIX family)
MSKHKNDIYGEVEDQHKSEEIPPPIPAATVLLLRDEDEAPGPEVLMLHKTSKIAFGGMWVFPGGKIDPEDYSDDNDVDNAARRAAVREAEEEAGIRLPMEAFTWFSHWTPPPITPKRYATWFFVTEADEDHEITIDGGEIQDHQWINPGEALARHAKGEIDLAPPTWISLYQISKFETAAAAVDHLAALPPRYYETRIVQDDDGARIAMWAEDSGYDTMDSEKSEQTHRLVMKAGSFEFEHTAVKY